MKKIFVVATAIALVATGAWLALPKLPLLEGVPFSTVVRDRDGAMISVRLASDDKFRVFTPLASISPRIVEATLSHEDRHFTAHPGVDPIALARAAWGLLSGSRAGGASTVTMQVARLRYGLHTRSVIGKCLQIFDALCIERHYSKREILEAYFNLIPYGRNIEGVGTAAWLYLHHSPDNVSWAEASTLAVIPQSPLRRAPHPARDNPSLLDAHRRLYDQLLARKIAPDPIGKEFALRLTAPEPSLAPHFVQAVQEDADGSRDIRTTLDSADQRIIEKAIGQFVRAQAALGVHNAAAMLVDTRTMEVLASVGSADFWNSHIDGQVDGTRSPRSPGSTLKPFIYALALDEGLIHPHSLLLDAPQRFAGYTPDNFDREFCGPISAMDALVRSRNVPAVELASRLKSPGLYDFLRSAEVPLRSDEASYGLALALGGAEITMSDLTRLYSMLANGGILRPLKTIAGQPESHGRRVLSVEASFLTLDMLSHNPRPDEDQPDPNHAVAWKTGTSFGFHDAWSVAVFDHFVLAVWVGNFNGTPNSAFVGRSCAAPLLFQIVDALTESGRAHPGLLEPPPGANLKRVEFCADSGDMAGPHCPHRVTGWFIPGVSPITACDVHREVWVDKGTGLRQPQDNGNCRREVFEFWPSSVLQLFAQAGLPRRTPPPFAPDCDANQLAREGNAPRILSPSGGEPFVAGWNGRASIALEARTDADVRQVHWFSGSEYLGCTPAGQALSWNAPIGKWHLLALDDQGRSSACNVTVLATYQKIQ
jgi:penicillin-binding protein 1C